MDKGAGGGDRTEKRLEERGEKNGNVEDCCTLDPEIDHTHGGRPSITRKTYGCILQC